MIMSNNHTQTLSRLDHFLIISSFKVQIFALTSSGSIIQRMKVQAEALLENKINTKCLV